MIPVPKLNTEEGGEWEEGEFEVAYRLKEKPRHELSEKVLAEERERLRGLQGKGSLLFGLIGMIIALVTVLAN